MVTNYPIGSRQGVGTTSDTHTDGLGVFERVRQMMCGLRGHDMLLHFEHARMALRCVSCGHESPGWELNEPRPTVTMCGDARRTTLRPHLVSERRIA
jgi:hypothetical protein